jgi:putative flavoprotein involved in K+ transport
VVPTRYRNPDGLRPGGALVVGASATGIQLAAEIARSGRAVTLAVGQHTRLPRRYRGRDIMAWLDSMGVLTETADDVGDIDRSRRQPSLQLVGSEDDRSIDIGILQAMGARIVGRLNGILGRRAYFADDLSESVANADGKMDRQLTRIDRFLAGTSLETAFPSEARPEPVVVAAAPAEIDLGAEGIQTVLWATGYRREYPWLRVPVLDAHGELRHEGGVTSVPGLYAVGLPFQRRRNSSFLDGVGRDAVELAESIRARLARPSFAIAG